MHIDESFLRLITDNVRDAIRVIDLKTLTYTYANAYARELFSKPGEEYIGTPLGPSLEGDEYKRVRDMMMDELLHDSERDPGRSVLMELREKPPGKDSFFWTENKATFIRDAGGIPVAILSITRDITERKLAEEQIQKSLREKEILLKEIHHRVKNNLQIIMSLLNLQNSRISNDEIKNLFSQCTTRIKAMALIHEMLYNSKELSSIDLKDYASALANELKEIYNAATGSPELRFSMTSVLLNIDKAIPCGLIINELVSNSFKYAFPEKLDRNGIIDISLVENEHFVELVVSDNGIGLPAYIDINNCESLGLSLVIKLAKQLRGTLEIIRDSGTAFKIRFPLH